MRVSLYDRLEAAERIERLAAKIYDTLARRFAWHDEATSLFRSLEAEEIQHALRIQLLTNQVRAQPKAYEAVHFDDRELSEAERLAEEAMDALLRGTFPTEFEAACAEVSELETRFAAAHTSMILKEAPFDVRRLFESLARQDKAHARLEIIRDSLPPPPPSRA